MSKFHIAATWADAPHLTPEAQEELLQEIPPHLRAARTKGIPSLGAGAIYPLDEDEILCEPFEVPEFWPRAYGLDVGWKRTAAIWGSWDRESNTVYLYSEYYRGQAEPSIHADAIRARGMWIPGAIDPAARGRGQVDGRNLLQCYTDLGLNLTKADNAVEAGIYACWQRLSAGRMKVFRTCGNWVSEYRRYRRDEDGKIVKEDDHLMDAMRYLVMTGLDIAKVDEATFDDWDIETDRNEISGY